MLGRALHGRTLGRPGQAAGDVFEQEPPLDVDDPQLRHPRLLRTPHLGYVEHDSYALSLGTSFDNVLAFAAGTPQHLANPEVRRRG